jgi:hypothetical protein
VLVDVESMDFFYLAGNLELYLYGYGLVKGWITQ